MAKRHTVFSLSARNCFLAFSICVIFFGTLPIHAQNDRHYNTIQYGLRGIIMNGAMVAGVHDNSSLYYNPAALSLADNEGFDISLFAISAEHIAYKDAYGDGISSNKTDLQFIPGLLTYNKSPFKNKNLRLAAGMFTRSSFQNGMSGKFIDETAEGITFNDVRIAHRGRDIWLSGAVSYAFDNNVAIGFCQYFSIGGNSYEHELNYTVFDPSMPGALLFKESDRLIFGQSTTFGMINRLGLVWTNNTVKLGVTFTTPTYAHILKRTNVRYDYTFLQQDSSYANKAHYSVKGEHKTPFGATVGFELRKGVVLIAAALEYHHRVKNYDMASALADDVQLNINGTKDFSVQDGRRRVFNINLGWEIGINEHIDYLGGLRTNFNYNNQPSGYEQLRLHQSYFDLYHITNGFKVSKGKNNFTVGVDYAFSFNKNLPAIANLAAEGIQTSVDNTASIAYTNITFLITYSFLLDKFKNLVNE